MREFLRVSDQVLAITFEGAGKTPPDGSACGAIFVCGSLRASISLQSGSIGFSASPAMQVKLSNDY